MRTRHAKSWRASIWGLFALLLLSACGSTPPKQVVRTEEVEVKVPVLVPLPSDLTRNCDVPAFPDRITVGDMQDLVIFLYTSIEICNQEKEGIRELQPLVE